MDRDTKKFSLGYQQAEFQKLRGHSVEVHDFQQMTQGRALTSLHLKQYVTSGGELGELKVACTKYLAWSLVQAGQGEIVLFIIMLQ